MHPQAQKIFFLHIPKTAGYTFHHILFRQYPYTRHAILAQTIRADVYRRLSPARKKSYGVVRGHFVYGLHREPGDTGLCLTFLREPIMRTISGYEYIYQAKQHPFHAQMVRQQYSLYDFLDQQHIRNFDNIQVRFLYGDNTMPFGAINETHLEKAWENLQSSDLFFGLTERFDETILYFRQVLGCSMPWYQRLNVTHQNKVDRQHIDEKLMQKLLEVNRYDLILYERAKALFNERIQALGPVFQDEVQAFRQQNKNFVEPRKTLVQRIRNFGRYKIIR